MTAELEKCFIEGERLYFRGFERRDLEGDYRVWINDPEVTRYISVGSFPQTDDGLNRYFEGQDTSSSSVLFAIIEKSSGKHIGNSQIYDIDWLHRTALRGVVLGDKSCWGKGYALEVIQLLHRYAFETLNLNKLTSSTCSDNEAIQRLNLKAGYTREGVGREEFYRGGRYHDRIYWGLLRSEYFAQQATVD
ncbi:MAG: GNAT family protein [Pseudomonadota bacterium]